MSQNNHPEQMNIVVIGHVDHGKSSLIGRLLADTNSLPEGKLESIKAMCEKNSKIFEYAFLLDALEHERDQGITIDMARCFFKTQKRQYIILDAPGHIEFLKNMITGASRAEAAVLVIDAKEGIQENSKRHGLLAHMLGIKQVMVAVNKMDLVDFSQERFLEIQEHYTQFLNELGVTPTAFVPISAIQGDNLVNPSPQTPWYKQGSILEGLDSFEKEFPLEKKPFRMPLQDVYKFTAHGGDQRYFAGKVESGSVQEGDEVIFLPSGKKSRIKGIHAFNKKGVTQAITGQSTALTFEEQIYVQRGDLCVKTDQPLPEVSRTFQAHIFWMGKKPLVKNKSYFFKLGTAKREGKLKSINSIIDAQTLKPENKYEVANHDVADCTFELKTPLAFDKQSELEPTSRFVIVDDYEIRGGGIIQGPVLDDASASREAIERELKFIHGPVTSHERAKKYSQKPLLIVVTGLEESGHKELAQKIDEVLFMKGRASYYLGMGSLKYGLDTDLKASKPEREEYIRRLGEVSYLMLDAGLITVVSARGLNANEVQMIDELTLSHQTLLVGLGSVEGHFSQHIQLTAKYDEGEALTKVFEWLEDKGHYFTL